ncbi:hydroxyacylglutathione hydrolase [Aliikangiella sp. G2MR2-5]|uniref:hydroxyacylglutathione hydrolase n=1 Tax=Aliikangiella sp. G2MR2-5 TaxID=2788943 RepID=UPI0018A9082A|nr:hydroxyacylglutathione hydrolase [Aliikangiella sp. G2MR2-5]
MFSITPVPAFNDNYLWVLHNSKHALVVDPGDPVPVIRYLTEKNLKLCAILITHHHADHTGGMAKLSNEYKCPTYGPENDPVANLDHALVNGNTIEIPELELGFNILGVPGHTLGHIAYYSDSATLPGPILFCGDTLFSGGCGRLFEGSPEQMWDSLQKLRALPDSTQVFPAHEYTLANLKFAQAVEPKNKKLADYLIKAQQTRLLGNPTLPSTIELEKQINPFLRVNEDTVKMAAELHSGHSQLESTEIFSVIRQWKDNF